MMIANRESFAAARRRGPKLPYDYEVAYIERDYSVPWVVEGSTTAGIDLSRYLKGESLVTSTRRVDLEWCFSSLSPDKSIWGLYYPMNFLREGQSLWRKSNEANYYRFSTYKKYLVESSGIDEFHVQTLIPDGEGGWTYLFDGSFVGNATYGSTAPFKELKVLYGYSGFTDLARVRSVKIGEDVDMIPVVKGDEIGFYNKVDGEMVLERQDCLSAGPKV